MSAEIKRNDKSELPDNRSKHQRTER